MYGTQDASNLWRKDYTELIATDEYMPGRTNPAIFYSPSQDGRLYVHGDDFALLADQAMIRAGHLDCILNIFIFSKVIWIVFTEAVLHCIVK